MRIPIIARRARPAAATRALGALLLVASPLSLGCGAALQPPPILSDTQLGRVIIYRNGVAYFERYAPPDQKEMEMRVPAERVDDFLKSLTVADEQTGKTMPISYPTAVDWGGYVAMTIKLPEHHQRLRITYVTESPAWKPSYRIVLGADGGARLQAWAVVDNVSGEDWKQVRMGVGSTSALSFRYDLHSVRLVERETLSTGTALAAAPPTGGSPYAVATRKLRIVGNLTAADLDNLAPGGRGAEAAQAAAAGGGGDGYDFAIEDVAAARAPLLPEKERDAKKAVRGRDIAYLRQLSQQLQAGEHRVRIEGFAQHGDGDPNGRSLARANAIRDQLVALGVPAARIDTVGTGVMNTREVVRIAEADEAPVADLSKEGQEGEGTASPLDTRPAGQAHFVSAAPMSIEKDHSAMVSILNAPAKAERVYYYDPVSARGSKQYAFNAVRLVNPSEYTLDSGPFTVYAGGQFLGEGLSEPILPKGVAFIPYALDRSILAQPEVSSREEIDELLTIERGIITAETRGIRRTTVTLTNRGQHEAKVYVRHKVGPGYKLAKQHQHIEKLGGAHLFPVTIKAGEGVALGIEEETPLLKTVDIHTQRGIDAMALFLKKGKLEPELAAKLADVIKKHSARVDLQDRIDTLDEQMTVYRTRVDELNVQLVTLKKVPQAAKLQQHLATKMEEISDKLQEATIEMSDLKGQQMTLAIELQDKLSEITLERRKPAAADEAGGVAHE